MKSIEVQCDLCKGTGLERDPRDPELGWICAQCDGSAKVTLEYTPFKGRKRLDGIRKVAQLAPGHPQGTTGPTISYDDFLKEEGPYMPGSVA